MVSLAYCGIKCQDCPAFIATKAKDLTKRKRIAKEWSTKEYPLTYENVECHGCTSTIRTVMAFCEDCEIRECARSKKLDNCSLCTDFPCQNLEKVYKKNPEAKMNLLNLRKT